MLTAERLQSSQLLGSVGLILGAEHKLIYGDEIMRMLRHKCHL
jgi:hypothetical protein